MASIAEARHSRALAESTAMPALFGASKEASLSRGSLVKSLRVEEKLLFCYYSFDSGFEIQFDFKAAFGVCEPHRPAFHFPPSQNIVCGSTTLGVAVDT